ncbi:NADPH-dependent oxidoreductase [Actinomycetaceae bacterium WB03_NA08]|uniref:NADPH-dependent oxidoreductase n=1 Tax=Scrofimicrobium canadense TaxID=2652290 RepID=A0A6N7W662_9ACTO|nr:nitroreductase family protein [Scrofimicrobium canadense]MSS84881.1 NADPH-dependent oxidoreductase [Scrofimicrobium canadense]
MEYRQQLPVSTPAIDVMTSHHSVRRYADEPISEDHLLAILASASSAATSSNQNSWSVIVVRDRDLKHDLMEATGKNPFIAQAPVFLVWVADLSRAHRLAEKKHAVVDALQYQEALLVGTIDATLAAQNAVVAAESFGMGTCYVGGIRTNIEKVCGLLNLPEYSYPVVGLALGWPADQAGVKPRLPLSSVAFNETYDVAAADAGIEELDRTTAEYFESQGFPGVVWSQKALQRWAGPEVMNGREKNREVIARRGLLDL